MIRAARAFYQRPLGLEDLQKIKDAQQMGDLATPTGAQCSAQRARSGSRSGRATRERADQETPDEFFSDKPQAKELFAAIRREIEAIGAAGVRVTKSRVAFRRRRSFACVWMAGRYLSGRAVPPLVLTVFLRERDPSPRWKEIVEPSPGRFTHHLELRDATEIDEEVRGWLRKAWESA